MAEEAEEELAADVPPPSASPFRYIMLIVLIMIIEAVGGYFFLDYAIPAREVVPLESEEEAVVVPTYVKPVFFSGLEDMIVNPAVGRNTLVMISLILELGPGNTEASLEELNLKRDLLWDLCVQELEKLEIGVIRDPKKVRVKEIVMQVANEELRNGSIEGVYVTKLVLQ